MSTKTSQSEKQKVPKLRFAGFDGEWEEKKLGEVTKINQGLQIPISERFLEKVENSYFYITNEFLKENSQKEYYIKNPSESVLCNEDDILMTRTGNTGHVVTNVSGAFHNNFFKIKFDKNEIEKNFLYYFLVLPKTNNFILRLAGTSTIPDLNHGDFYKIKINFPTLTEQQKIAGFLSEVDELIENLKEQKESFELYKKGMMQKIFSQEIRFKDENGKEFPEWKEKKLDEVGKIITGTTPSTLNKKYYSGHFPWITPTDINGDKNIYTSTRLLTQEGIDKGRFVSKNSLLVTCIASIGKNAILRVDGSCNQQINAISPTTKNNVDFLYYMLEKNKNTLIRFAGAGGMQMLNKKDFSNLKFKVPVLSEQQRIADFLTSINKVIESKQQQISQAEKWKKALMQGLFV